MPQPLSDFIYADEAACVDTLLDSLSWDEARAARVGARAADFVTRVRGAKRKVGELESFLQQFGLNSEEGLALMTLAEALLRIPDAHTADLLIKDKIAAADWLSKMGEGGGDILTRAAGFGLSLTRKTLEGAAARLGQPVIRAAIVQAMRMMGGKFVLGRTIEEGVRNAREYQKKGYRLSYDMLGEGARTAEDAERYFTAYRDAIIYIGKESEGAAARPGMSVKLSALHPRYEYRHEDICLPILSEKLTTLARLAADAHVNLTVDAEEADRLESSLKIINAVTQDKVLNGWEGFGLAVQAYQKRCFYLVDHVTGMARAAGRRMQVRLVKGAYWDTEIKRAQVHGLADYPVFTRKVNTDLSYIACAKKMLERRDIIYPMFATHNAHTVAAILELAGNDRDSFEFQRLHGMGETLHDLVLGDGAAGVSVYAPCGSHEDLLPYLVRRLLENGANSSFVNQLLDARVTVETVAADPVKGAKESVSKRHGRIPLPAALYGENRVNARGMDLTDAAVLRPLIERMKKAADGRSYEAAPLIAGKMLRTGEKRPVINPADKTQTVGAQYYADATTIDQAFAAAREGFEIWSRMPAQDRAAVLEKLADLMQKHGDELMGLCVREAGKTIDDALAELREAVDFCRYYAQQGRCIFSGDGQVMPGPTGERNILTLHGRGTFVCISPWNFPLAIFMGQAAAALMAGNAVIAKPAEQTPLIAMRAAQLVLEAGVPPQAFALLPGDGAVGAKMIAHRDVAGAAFTGSTEVARLINRALAAKDGPIVPLIAETGGQNAMIVDSSALPEQIVDDALISAFGSAGQRCSALRVLYVQDDVADKIISMLKGAMAQRRMGDPMDPSSDIGPLIDTDALARLATHRQKMEKTGRFIAQMPLSTSVADKGFFFAPCAYEIDNIAQIGGEVFGPFLHVIRYQAKDMPRIIQDVNATGFGLTFGLHTRISSVMSDVTEQAGAGNCYINRTMIGAVVGVQPFGGHGLSGTGPKAGGPYYLHRFATEKVVSTDTARGGGNAALLGMGE